jgi:hypothetical protein
MFSVKVGGPQSRSGRLGEDKGIVIAGTGTQDRPVRSLDNTMHFIAIRIYYRAG